MMHLVQILATIILFAVCPAVAGDYFSQSGFIDDFMKNQSVGTMGTMLAIYIAAAASFLAIMVGHENDAKKSIFSGTASELKQNSQFVIVLFFMHFLLVCSTPREATEITQIILRALKTLTFSLYVYALYELSNVLFGIRETLRSLHKTTDPKIEQSRK